MHIREPEITSGVTIGQRLVIDPQQMQNRGMQIMHAHRVLLRGKAESWAESCEVSITRESKRRRFEQREVIVSTNMRLLPKFWKWAGMQSVIYMRRETVRQRHCG